MGTEMNLREIQKDVGKWADGLIPTRTAHGALVKLMTEEMCELSLCKCDDPEELADCLIVLLDICYLKGIDAADAIAAKMKKNRARKWARDERGLLKHVKD